MTAKPLTIIEQTVVSRPFPYHCLDNHLCEPTGTHSERITLLNASSNKVIKIKECRSPLGRNQKNFPQE